MAETARLRLRVPEERDVDGLAAMYADPEVMRYMGGRLFTRDDAATQLQTLVQLHRERGWSLWTVERLDDAAFLGRAGLLLQELDDGEHVEMAYAYARAHWGRGYATEAAHAIAQFAFERLEIERLISIVHVDNLASQRVAQKAGLRFWRATEFRGFPVRVFARSR